MRRLTIFFLANSLASPALARPAMLPPDLLSQAYLAIDDVDEPVLWLPNALHGYRNRYRLSISGIVCRSYTLRLDVDRHGVGTGQVKSWNRCKKGSPYSQRTFHLRAEQVTQLEKSFSDAGLWSIYPQFWRAADDQICVDGEELSFEWVGSAGFRFAQANAQCEAPRSLVAAARAFLNLAHERAALSLLD